MKKGIAIYAGTFDPITLGHVSVVRRGLSVFDKIIVAVAEDTPKDTLFSLEERMQTVREVFKNNKSVTVESFSGLLVKYAKRKGATTILRGLRSISDFDMEFQMALANRKLSPNIETVFIMSEENVSYFSSSIVKEIAKLGGCLTGLVPNPVIKMFKKKLKTV